MLCLLPLHTVTQMTACCLLHICSGDDKQNFGLEFLTANRFVIMNFLAVVLSCCLPHFLSMVEPLMNEKLDDESDACGSHSPPANPDELEAFV